MKEVCGYKDSKGRFHDTIEETELAESLYKLEKLEGNLDNIESRLRHLIDSKYSWRGDLKERDYLYNIKDDLLEALSKSIFLEPKIFLEIINSKAELQKALDERTKEYKTKKQNLAKPWYLKFKWW